MLQSGYPLYPTGPVTTHLRAHLGGELVE